MAKIPEGYEKQESVGFWKPETEGEELQGVVTEVDKEGTYGTQWTIETNI